MENGLMVNTKQLPATIKDLQKFILVSREALKAYRAKVNVVNKLGLAQEVRNQTLGDGQRVGEALLLAEAKMGDLLKDIETSHGGSIDNKKGGSKKSLPEGLTHKQSYFAQQLSEHKDLIAEVVAEAVENEDLPTRKEVLRKAREIEHTAKIDQLKNKEIMPPEGKYHCLVIDPPWQMNFTERENHPNQIGLDYPTLSLDEIKKLSVPDLAHDNCHLYLWTTHKHLLDCFGIVEAWGFRYQCLMTWVKNVGFTPFSWMYTTEHVLFCTKGNLPLLQKGMRLDFSAKTTGHSQKPDIFYELVEKASPEPRLDMFSRKEHHGFIGWGKEAPSVCSSTNIISDESLPAGVS